MIRNQCVRTTARLGAVLMTAGQAAAGGQTQHPAGVPAAIASEQVPEGGGRPTGGWDKGGDDGGVADIGLTIIDFESLRHDDALVTDIGELIEGQYYGEDGYYLVHGDGENPFATFGTQEDRYPGSTALFNNSIGGTTRLSPADNIPFTLVCLEVSNLNRNGPATVTFAGRRQDDTYVYKTVTTGVDYNRLETFYFEEFNNLVWVTWTQESPYIQFDNIGVTKATPEMNFQKAEHADDQIRSEGSVYAEGDFVIVQGEGEPSPLCTFGTQHPHYPGSTALFNNTADGAITLYSLSTTEEYAEPFNIHSIDLANLNGQGSNHVTFVGKKADGSTVEDTFEWQGQNNVMHTFSFAGFHDLISLSWTQKSPFHQFDNLVVSRGQRVLEFEKLARQDGQSHGWGPEYREAGFRLRTDGDLGYRSFGTESDRWPGSTALFDKTDGGRTELMPIDGRLFAARSIDIASLNGATPVTVTFTGAKDDGVEVTQSFTTSGNGQRLETFVFDKKFRRLRTLEWKQVSPYHQFDSITLVPNQTDSVDFQDLEHTDNGLEEVGASYTEGGYVIRRGKDDPHPLATWGTHAPGYAQSTAMFNNTAGGLIRLSTQSGNDFDLLEIDLAKLGPVGDASQVTFVGTKTDGSQVSQTFTIYPPFSINRLQTCHFEGFDSLTQVEWHQVSPYHQFDNITLVESVSKNGCYPDFTGDGTLDLFDFLAYVNAFNAGSGDAECDGDGDLTLFDFLCYVNAFNAGC